MKNEVYAVIDLKSFYASCECANRGLDIFNTPLVVADKTRSPNSVVMSVTPYLKQKYGLSNVCRIGDLPNDKNIIFATPRMSYYVEMSSNIVSLFLDYVSEEDLHVYSIDESFLRLTPYLKLYGCNADELVARIQKDIYERYHLIATSGMGPNMFLAKACLDNEGKKKPPYRSYWGIEDVPNTLWKLRSLTDFWGISGRTANHLKRIGIRSVEGLAKADERLMKREFGVIGLELKALANGIDRTDITKKYTPKERSFSQGQTLMRDYWPEEALLILKETIDELCIRLRKANQVSSLISVYVGDSDGGGFSRQRSLEIPSDDNDILLSVAKNIYHAHVEYRPIRSIGASFGKLRSYSGPIQFSLFENNEELREKRTLRLTMDSINDIYGKNAILSASSLLSESTIRERHGYIGGHRA